MTSYEEAGARPDTVCLFRRSMSFPQLIATNFAKPRPTDWHGAASSGSTSAEIHRRRTDEHTAAIFAG